MSWSVGLKVVVQTATDLPLAELALSDSNWLFPVNVLPRNSLPSDRSWRPSSASMSRRRRRGRRSWPSALAEWPPFVLNLRNMAAFSLLSMGPWRPHNGADPKDSDV